MAISLYSSTCHGRPPLVQRKSGPSWQVAPRDRERTYAPLCQIKHKHQTAYISQQMHNIIKHNGQLQCCIQTAEVETAVGRTGPLSVQRGVRQGCPLSPMLFNLYSELIMRHALEKWEDGIEIGGKLYNNLRYADDVALLATTEGKLQELVNAVGKASERFGLSLNAKKTQVMVIGRHTSTINIMYNGAPLEQVKQIIYLGASFNEKGDTIKEVKRRVAIAKRASGVLHRIWRNRELPIPLKLKLVQLMIWPIMSYGSETWIYI